MSIREDHCVDMREARRRHQCRVVYEGTLGTVLFQTECRGYFIACPDAAAAEALASRLPKRDLLLCHERETAEIFCRRWELGMHPPFCVAVYEKDVLPPETGADIRPMEVAQA